MTDRPNHESDINQVLGLDASASKHRTIFSLRNFLIAIPVMLLIALLLALRNGDTDQTRYITSPVSRGDLQIRVTATGNLQPTNQVDVGSEVSGKIDQVFVDDNDKVTQGQTLAILDTSTLNAQVLASEAAMEAASARVLEAEATVTEAGNELSRLEKVHKLSDGRVPSQSELDSAAAAEKRARATLANARANESQARATLDQQRSNLGKATIVSPVNGIVLSREIDPGQTVAAQFQAPVLFVLAEDLTTMELQVDVDEADVGKVNAGQQATFTVDAYPGRSFPAEVTRVRFGSQEVDGVITYQTTLTVNNGDLLLRPGMTATADIIVQDISDALLVPAAALRFSPPSTTTGVQRNGNLLSRILPGPPRRQLKQSEKPSSSRQVWALDKGVPTAIPVVPGVSDGVHTQVINGALTAGMEVIVDSSAVTP